MIGKREGEKNLNWLISKYYINIEYKNLKCLNCGIEIILIPIYRLNRNIRMNLDGSPHTCERSC